MQYKGVTNMRKLTADEKNQLEIYAISFSNAAGNYERIAPEYPHMKNELLNNYFESKRVLFDYIESL